jgi:peptidoglycan/LPS O-acetylase OafA/YrhL
MASPAPLLNNAVTFARSPSAYIPTLDGWRCVAISLVLFAHTYVWLGFGTTKLGSLLHYPAIGIHIRRTGETGVGVFFCISGFLITKLLVDHGMQLKSFYVRRAFRILPPALLYLVFVSTLGALGLIAVHAREIVASLFFYRNYLDYNAWSTGHFWSLSIEEQFYLVWPSVLAFAGIKRSRVFLVFSILGIVVWRQMHWPLPAFAGFHTDMRLDAILCGCLMALSWPTLMPVIQKASRVIIPTALIGFWAADFWSVELKGIADFIQAMLACLLIASTVASPARLLARLLEKSAVAWVGRMSYSIYLWQQLFLVPAGNPHWQLPLRLAGIIVVAWVSYAFIERPLIAVGRRLIDRRTRVEPDQRLLKLEEESTASCRSVRGAPIPKANT